MAAEEYGVVIRDNVIDEEATRQRRAEMAAYEANGFYGFNAARTAFEQVWNRANYDALTEILASLPVHWRFFVKHKIFALMSALPEQEGIGTGVEVHRAFAMVRAQYPQLDHDNAR
jgi:N-methylhydantoinase B